MSDRGGVMAAAVFVTCEREPKRFVCTYPTAQPWRVAPLWVDSRLRLGREHGHGPRQSHEAHLRRAEYMYKGIGMAM